MCVFIVLLEELRPCFPPNPTQSSETKHQSSTSTSSSPVSPTSNSSPEKAAKSPAKTVVLVDKAQSVKIRKTNNNMMLRFFFLFKILMPDFTSDPSSAPSVLTAPLSAEPSLGRLCSTVYLSLQESLDLYEQQRLGVGAGQGSEGGFGEELGLGNMPDLAGLMSMFGGAGGGLEGLGL